MIVGKKNRPPESLETLVKSRFLAWAKKTGDTVIAKPYKTLGKRAFQAGYRPRARVAGRRHNPWRTLESMENHWEHGFRMCRAPRTPSGAGQKKTGDTVIAKPCKTLGKQAFPAGCRPRGQVAGRRHSPWRTLEPMENHWKNMVSACPAHPARQVGLGKRNKRHGYRKTL